LSDIIIKSGRKSWAGHVAHMGGKKELKKPFKF
jgi:hypothetical protein